MSRQSMLPQRNLTLMEELEKIEQSITLTLQEIDHNFSRAHRIVTTSILPVVEQYARHSNAVWQGSEFWKGFFEASANVQITNYAESAEGEETVEEESTQTLQDYHYRTPPKGTEDDTMNTTTLAATPKVRSSSRTRAKKQTISSSPTSSSPATHTTPPAQRSTGASSLASGGAGGKTEEASFADYPSPYETLKQEMSAGTRSKPSTTYSKRPAAAPTTPGIPRFPPPSQTGPDSSPFLAPPTTTYIEPQQRQSPQKATGSNTARKTTNTDPLLYRVLDKNYRIQATPLKTTRKQPGRVSPTKRAGSVSPKKASVPAHHMLLDSSPFSPPVAAPQLRSEIFGSPVRASAAPRTPGVSVQKGKRIGGQFGFARRGTGRTPRAEDTANIFGGPAEQRGNHEKSQPRAVNVGKAKQVWESDSDDGLDGDDRLEEMGISPPKTLQFHVPASRLLQTPAREASKRIVEDLMRTAGMEVGGESTLEGGVVPPGRGMGGGEDAYDVYDDIYDEDDDGAMCIDEEDSPSVVRVMRRDADADAF